MSAAARVSLGLVMLVCAEAAAHADASAAAAKSDPLRRYRLELADGWRRLPVSEGSLAPHVGFEHRPSRALLAVNRVDYPNLDAWRQRTFPTYADEVEAGFRESVTRYRRLARRTTRLGSVPAMDLSFRHRVGNRDQVVVVRMLFFRRYSLSLIVSVPGSRYRAHKKRFDTVRQSFQPQLGQP